MIVQLLIFCLIVFHPTGFGDTSVLIRHANKAFWIEGDLGRKVEEKEEGESGGARAFDTLRVPLLRGTESRGGGNLQALTAKYAQQVRLAV